MNAPGRIESVDLLRGFALLGILVMNISSFALPVGSYFNPLSFEPTLLNKVIHGISHILADQKMMALFSMLFGASMILLMEKTEAAGARFGRRHYARTGWLLLFGLLHHVFLWEGDILSLYAFCGFLIFLARRWPGWLNFALGLLIFLAPVLWAPSFHGSLEAMDEEQVEAVNQWWAPPAEKIEESITLNRGSYGETLSHRMREFGDSEEGDELGKGPAIVLAMEALCRAMGMMLIGMALFRWGILSGQRSRAFYRRGMAIGLGLGFPVAGWGLRQLYEHGFAYDWSLSLGRVPNHVATLLVAGGYLSMIMLWSRSDRLPRIRRRFADVGRMAFSNYVGQTLLATAIFFGWGFGLFARLNRLELLLVVAAVWTIQLAISPWWLARFRYGPLEWLWRTLSAWKIQPMRR